MVRSVTVNQEDSVKSRLVCRRLSFWRLYFATPLADVKRMKCYHRRLKLLGTLISNNYFNKSIKSVQFCSWSEITKKDEDQLAYVHGVCLPSIMQLQLYRATSLVLRNLLPISMQRMIQNSPQTSRKLTRKSASSVKT